jgi:hypothetical protein
MRARITGGPAAANCGRWGFDRRLVRGLALHDSGFDVNVYERHPGPMDTRGAGTVVQGELVQLLDTYGAQPLPTTMRSVFSSILS